MWCSSVSPSTRMRTRVGGQAERAQCAFQRVGVLVARGEAIVERGVPGRAGDVRQWFHVTERGQVLVRTQQHLGRHPLPHAVQRHAFSFVQPEWLA